jgi:hypothetical protein
MVYRHLSLSPISSNVKPRNWMRRPRQQEPARRVPAAFHEDASTRELPFVAR